MLSNKCCLKKSSITKKVLTMGTVTVVSLVVLSVVSSAVIFNAVFQRRTVSPYELIMSYSDSEAENYPRRQLSFMSGEKLLKGYVYGEQNQKGIIIIANGFNAGASGHLGEVFYFADKGWTVLAFDGTGVGDSQGDSVVGLEQMRLDVLAAMDYIKTDEALCELPVFLYGHSAGGYAAATLCNDERVSAVVSISGFDSPLDTMRFYAAKYVGVFADVEYPFIQLYDRYRFGENGGIRATEQLSESKHPVMIVQGSEDETIPYELSIYAACEDENYDNVRCVLVDEEYRNHHSTIWLKAASAEKLLEIKSYKDEMLDTYGHELPDEVEEALIANAAAADGLLKDVNEDFLGEVSRFFEETIK
ncbi:MAG: alpha/beta fold hydrolase [Bacillota bacterium]|nr:alpha/beta fold hydrolase [Bacillota bacterium]